MLGDRLLTPGLTHTHITTLENLAGTNTPAYNKHLNYGLKSLITLGLGSSIDVAVVIATFGQNLWHQSTS